MLQEFARQNSIVTVHYQVSSKNALAPLMDKDLREHLKDFRPMIVIKCENYIDVWKVIYCSK